MGLQQSKGELLYQQVLSGNAEKIRDLHDQGADLEWTDIEGKTPLMLACMNAKLYHIAELLIQLGANVNASAPASYTPLLIAASSGLENTVKLLLSNGVNANYCHKPLQTARCWSFSNIVREIESHICLFSGWMREFYSPAYYGKVFSILRSRKVWVVIVPTDRDHPDSLNLAVYDNLHDARPRTEMNLWVPIFQRSNEWHSSKSATISDKDTSLTLAPATEDDSQQLKWFCDACQGIPKPMHRPVFLQTAPSAPPLPSNFSHHSISQASSSSGPSSSTAPPPPSGKASAIDYISHGIGIVLESSPSAPPLTDDDIATVEEGPIHYPSIDSTPVDVPSASSLPASTDGERKEDGSTGTCAICLDAPSEAVCVPCGHVAGCMSCLNEIKSKKWGCPVCRAKIDQVIKLYRV